METFQKIYPLEYYHKFLTQAVRPDGRSLLKPRKANISTGSVTSANASAFVKLGNTSVVVGIKAEVGKPPLGDQSQTIINVELTPLCSSLFISGKPSVTAMSLSVQLNSLVNSTSLIPTSELVFDSKGTLVWYLYLDIYCLDYDGNVYDACVLAMQAALRDLKLGEGEINEKGEPILNNDLPQRSISIRHVLVPLTFVVLSDYLLADPTHEEETLSSTQITIVYNSTGLLCEVYKPGGVILTDEKIRECMARAKARIKDVVKLLEKACPTKFITIDGNNNKK